MGTDVSAPFQIVLCSKLVELSSKICTWLKHGIGADFFHVISMLQKKFVLEEHFIRVMQKYIVSSCLPENSKLLTLPVLEIWSKVLKKWPFISVMLSHFENQII